MYNTNHIVNASWGGDIGRICEFNVVCIMSLSLQWCIQSRVILGRAIPELG